MNKLTNNDFFELNPIQKLKNNVQRVFYCLIHTKYHIKKSNLE